MFIYILIYAVVFLMVLIWKDHVDQKKVNQLICIVGFLLITLMLGLRHPYMGVDLGYLRSTGYLGSFDRIANISWKEIFDYNILNYERGYIVFNKFVSSIFNDRQFFLMACAIICILPIAYLVYKRSCSTWQSFIVYLGLPCFLMTYSGLRQAIAISLCFYSIKYIQDKRIYKFIFLVLIASAFHSTALIFLIAYPFYYLKMSLNMRIFTIIFIPIVYIFRNPLFTLLSSIFKDDAIADNNNSITLLLVFSLVYIFCIVYNDHSEEQNGLANLFLMACICQVFGGVYNTAIRVGYYFMIALVLLLPSTLKNMTSRYNKNTFSTATIMCFTLFGLYSIYASTWARACPYYFFWQNV